MLFPVVAARGGNGFIAVGGFMVARITFAVFLQRVVLCDLAPQRSEPGLVTPVAPSLKPKPAQRRAEFAGMAVAAPAPTQRSLK
jgi:hypothetical protein